MGDLEALLPMADKKNLEPLKKRVCLRHYDLVPAQMLNAMGASGIEKAPMKTLWETMMKGNKATAYFSEYCSEDADRQAIALSRFCEVMVAAIRRLQDPLSNKVIQEKVYAEASKEASELLPYLLKLNRGRSGGSAPSTIRGLAYASSGADAVDPTEVRTAAACIRCADRKSATYTRIMYTGPIDPPPTPATSFLHTCWIEDPEGVG